MRLKNTSPYPDAEVRELVEFACKGVNMTGVAVNVKGSKYEYAGMAYDGVPSISPLYWKSDVSRLVTIRIGRPEKFPTDTGRTVTRNGVESREGYGGKRSPIIQLRNWQEALVMVAAHEARHIHQFRNRKRRSEIDAEKFAAKRVEAFRKEVGA